MNPLKTISIAFFLVGAILSAASPDVLQTIDSLYYTDVLDESVELIEEELAGVSNDSARAELLWRHSRVSNRMGYMAETAGDKSAARDYYTEGRILGEQAIDADSSNAMTYFWTAVNVGTEARIRGIMQSLSNAEPMRDLVIEAVELDPVLPDGYFVLGQLYEQVPGFVYGDKPWSVSYGRLSLDLHEKELDAGVDIPYRHDFTIHLARHLWARDWSVRKRSREIPKKADKYASADTAVEQGAFYEGIIEVPDMSDRDEARMLIESVIQDLQDIPAPTFNQADYLREALELKDKWS